MANYTLVKKYLIAKKQEYCKSMEAIFSKPSQPNPALPEPYSEDEIAAFEEQENVILPYGFRKYLTEISREVYASCHPTKVELSLEGTFESDKLSRSWSSLNGTMQIGDDGCGSGQVIVVRSKDPYEHGEIYEIWDEMGDGDGMGCCSDDFTGLFIRHWSTFDSKVFRACFDEIVDDV